MRFEVQVQLNPYLQPRLGTSRRARPAGGQLWLRLRLGNRLGLRLWLRLRLGLRLWLWLWLWLHLSALGVGTSALADNGHDELSPVSTTGCRGAARSLRRQLREKPTALLFEPGLVAGTQKHLCSRSAFSVGRLFQTVADRFELAYRLGDTTPACIASCPSQSLRPHLNDPCDCDRSPLLPVFSSDSSHAFLRDVNQGISMIIFFVEKKETSMPPTQSYRNTIPDVSSSFPHSFSNASKKETEHVSRRQRIVARALGACPPDVQADLSEMCGYCGAPAGWQSRTAFFPPFCSIE